MHRRYGGQTPSRRPRRRDGGPPLFDTDHLVEAVDDAACRLVSWRATVDGS